MSGFNLFSYTQKAEEPKLYASLTREEILSNHNDLFIASPEQMDEEIRWLKDTNEALLTPQQIDRFLALELYHYKDEIEDRLYYYQTHKRLGEIWIKAHADEGLHGTYFKADPDEHVLKLHEELLKLSEQFKRRYNDVVDALNEQFSFYLTYNFEKIN